MRILVKEAGARGVESRRILRTVTTPGDEMRVCVCTHVLGRKDRDETGEAGKSSLKDRWKTTV